jgi:hypothetical protein
VIQSAALSRHERRLAAPAGLKGLNTDVVALAFT